MLQGHIDTALAGRPGFEPSRPFPGPVGHCGQSRRPTEKGVGERQPSQVLCKTDDEQHSALDLDRDDTLELTDMRYLVEDRILPVARANGISAFRFAKRWTRTRPTTNHHRHGHPPPPSPGPMSAMHVIT